MLTLQARLKQYSNIQNKNIAKHAWGKVRARLGQGWGTVELMTFNCLGQALGMVGARFGHKTEIPSDIIKPLEIEVNRDNKTKISICITESLRFNLKNMCEVL